MPGSTGCDQAFAFIAMQHNGIFQIQASQRNCILARHPLTPQPCPIFTGPYTWGAGGHFRQTPVSIPKNQWVHLEAYYRASRTNGAVKFWQDGVLLFDFSNANIQNGYQFNTLDSAPPNYNQQDRNCATTGNVQPCYSDVYWLINNYLDPVGNPGTETMYVDDAKVTDTYQGPGGSPTPQPNPVAHWKLDESSGTTASDSAGSYPGTLTGGPVWNPTGGKINGALSFDGTDDYVNVGTGPNLANQSFTVSAWAKRSSTGTDDWVFTQGTAGANQAIIMGYRSNNIFTCAFYANDLDTPTAYTDTDWHLWTCTYDAATNQRTIYRDGAQVAQGTAAADYGGSGNTRIGSFQGTGFFPGLIDDVRIYNRALTPSEIQTLAAAATPTPTPTPTPGPIACSQYTPSSVIPTGYASPYDVVSSPSTNLMNVTCDVASARVDLGKGDPLQYIYNGGYLFKTGGTSWTPVSYTSSESLIAGAWYPKTATTNISLTSTELSQPSYVLTYLCTWIGSGWKCGCRDSACMQSYWQIQSFKR